MNSAGTHTAPAHAGFSLIEVLVALVVLSVGLLTVAALQVYGLRNEAMALNGTRATLLAADIVDRIRANPAAAEFYEIGAGEDAPAPGEDCADTNFVEVTAPCDPQTMAAYDLWAWRQAMAPGSPLSIPSATGAVEYLPGNPDVHRITVFWQQENQEQFYTLSIGR